MSKDKPELYELLKVNRSKLNNIADLPKEDKPQSRPAGASSDSEPIPYTAAQSSAVNPYPKLRIPFPTLKPKEPAIKINKPKSSSPRKEKRPVNYQKAFIIASVIAVIAIVLYLAWSQPKPSQPAQTETPPPESTTSITAAPAAATVTDRKWSLRLIYYNNNAENQHSVQKIIQFLNEKNISDVFTRNESINGVSCTSIYKGRYATPDEARKDLPQLKKLHYAFKNADAVEVKK